MIRKKYNFTPLHVDSKDSGDTSNENLVDGAILVGSQSEKVDFATLNKMHELEQPTPFEVSNVPESVNITEQ